MIRCGQILLIASLLVPPWAIGEPVSAALEGSVVSLTEEVFAGLHPVVVHQPADVVYSTSIDYSAYPLAELLAHVYPDWKRLIDNECSVSLGLTTFPLTWRNNW